MKDNLITPDCAFEWPREAMQQQDWLEASRRWAVLRKVYAEHPSVWIQAAIAHIEAAEFEPADLLLAHAREYFPNNPNAVVQSAELGLRRKDWALAELFLQQARDKFPDQPQVWIKSAQCAEHQGDLKQATVFNERARLLSPDKPVAFVQYAEFAMAANQWEEALSRWEILREKFPKHPAGYLRAAEASRQLARPQDARKLILARSYGIYIPNQENRSANAEGQHSRYPGIRRLIELIWTKAVFNLRSEVQRNFLSYGWWILEPLLHMIVYYVVFAIMLRRGDENYTVFLLTGLIPWLWFMKSVNSGSTSILASQNLIQQVRLPSMIFPLISLLQSALKQLPVFLLLFGFIWLQGHGPNIYWWTLLPVIIVQALLTVACASAVAAIIPFVRDLGFLVPTGLMLLMFMSGIFYDYRTISVEMQSLFLLNPVAFLLKCYREILLDGVSPDVSTLTWWGLGCAVSCVLVFWVYRRLQYIYPRIVME